MDSILPRNENSVDRVIRVLVGAAVLSLVWLGPQTAWGWAEVGPLIVVLAVVIVAGGTLMMRRWRRGLFAGGMALALMLSAQTANAEASCNREEAPELFVDMFVSTRIYPNADAALIGFAIGTVWRPTDKCLHIAGEGFTRFGRRPATAGDDLKMRTAGGAVGALWGNGDPNHWFGRRGLCSTWAGRVWDRATTS